MSLANLPDVIFVTKDPKEIELNLLKAWENGGGEPLAAADPRRLFFLTLADAIARLGASNDYASKMNLLAYAVDDFLDHMGAPVNTERLKASKARTTERFILSSPQVAPILIKQGTRVTKNGTNIYFQTLEPSIIQPGQTQVDVIVECLQAGAVGNGYLAGELDTLVDPIAFVQSVVNIESTIGGAEVEENESYRERIHLAPESFSVAGPEGAYIYHAKSTSPDIIDVEPTSPEPGKVLLSILLKNGELPNQAMIDKVYEKVSDRTVRPLTDHVFVAAPEVVNYDVEATWWISSKDLVFKSNVEANVTKALNDYVLWQKSKIGRSIDPSELNAMLKNAGAKRVEITSPTYLQLTKTQLAVAKNITFTFGGVEDG